MQKFVITIFLLLSCVLPVSAAKRIALVIGNHNYDYVIDLKNPGNDADLMESTLKDLDFEVFRYDDLDQRGMKQAMLDFGRKLKEGADASMFYYAGHGVEIGGVNYLVPRDADLKSGEEADIQNVSVNSFLALTENSNVPLNIVILDACRNNPFRSLRTSGAGGLAPVKAPRGTYVAYATSPGAVAVDGDSANSPFTLALSESMRQPGLTLEAVLKLTRSKVQTMTNGQQLPFDSSAITGEFYFVPAMAQAPAASPEAPKLFQLDTAQEAYQAAGDDLDLLRIVADKFPGTIWSDLALEKIKKMSPEKPIVKTTPILAAPPKLEEPKIAEPPPVVVPAPQKKDTVQRKTIDAPKKYVTPAKKVKPYKPVVKKAVRIYAAPTPKPKRKVVVTVAPRVQKVVVPPRPAPRVTLSCSAAGALQRGVMCNNGGRICRVASIRFSKGGGRPVLMGCR
jgi:uncharacterized caspase-like protein